MLVDTHCHLNEEEYDDLEQIIKDMNGIMIVSGYNDKTNLSVLELIDKYDNIYGTLGIHPENVGEITDDSFKIIEENICNPKIVAIGEIGLDYYWIKDNKDLQKKIFIKQLDLASKYNKPVVVHSRDAIQDIYDILNQYKLKGTIHCFNSSYEMAKKFIKLGYKIGVGGVVTFKNSKKLQDVVKKINLKDILLETDSPYLTPEPFRGKKNAPSYVYYVADKISKLKDVSLENVINDTYLNAMALFDLKI